jgi:hypothetical protein
MARKSWSTSRATSWWIVSVVFCLFCLRFPLSRPRPADLGVGLDELATELLEFAELRHFPLGLVDRGGSRQGLGDRFTVHFIGEPEIGTVAGLSGLMASTIRLATAARGARNGTGTKVAELRNLLSDCLPTLL